MNPFFDLVTTNLIASAAVKELLSAVLKTIKSEVVMTWIVFIMCWTISIVGVVASFLVLGSSVTGYRLWGISVLIAIGMISLSYFQKYARLESRTSFTPVDFISYLIQGFLWPTTWPTIAKAIGVSSGITPPANPLTSGENLLHATLSVLS
jgi:hypothetical protein